MSTPALGGELVVLPLHIPTEETRRQVAQMIACGLLPDQVYRVCNPRAMTFEQFERAYRREIADGGLQAQADVGAVIMQVALNPKHEQWFSAASFFARARLGWRDVRKVETDAKTDLPEEQKLKLIEAIINRLTTMAPKVAEGVKK